MSQSKHPEANTVKHGEKVHPKGTRRPANPLDKLLIGVLLVDAACFYISKIAFIFFTLVFIGLLMLKFAWERLHLEKKLQKYKWFRKFRFMMTFRKFRQMSKSINQTQVYLAKYLLGIPIEDGETEVKSFNDVQNSMGSNWPFMVPVKDTKDAKVTVKGKRVECVSSYSYLDLARDERVQEAAIEAAKHYSTGNHGPRMLCGNLEILETLEQRIAKFYRRESALVFSSGYLACMSAIAGVARKGDLLLMDKLTHASLKAGAKLSSAKIVYFKHNDFKDAERQIKNHKWERVIMVIEGVYSMDGDVGLLDKARALCDKYQATLILDEAHSLGAIGKTGHGTEEVYDWKYKADIICGTFTKSIASVGGFITCGKALRDFYTFYAPGLVFSAPLSAYHCGAADKSFEIIEQEPERVEKLQKNAEYLRNKFVEKGFNIGHSITCVIPVTFRDTVQCLKMHEYLLNKKALFTATVMAPACPVTAPRFRITAHSHMTKEEMDYIVESFIEASQAITENPELKELLEGM
jgi:8-amino-7-oxononanoate synthase